MTNEEIKDKAEKWMSENAFVYDSTAALVEFGKVIRDEFDHLSFCFSANYK